MVGYGAVRLGKVWLGRVRCGSAWTLTGVGNCPGGSKRGEAWHGMVWRGGASRGKVRLGVVWQGRETLRLANVARRG